jgi:4-hydroxy-tetrahydrodipicolinate reductase
MGADDLAVVVSGVPGRLASAIASAVMGAGDLTLKGVHNPKRQGEWEGVPYLDADDVAGADVVVECAPDDVVMDNLATWRRAGAAAVVGTSGFTSDRIDQARDLWGDDGPGCLIAPNFSIGAVLAMRFAELAAPHFATVEVIERHGAGKPDAPSGTALGTAARIAAAGGRSADGGHELVEGALGGTVDGVRVHSLRLEGLLSHQEVALTNPGEQLSLVHQSTSYGSFAAGAVAAVRAAPSLRGVHVGLDAVLGTGG